MNSLPDAFDENEDSAENARKLPESQSQGLHKDGSVVRRSSLALILAICALILNAVVFCVVRNYTFQDALLIVSGKSVTKISIGDAQQAELKNLQMFIGEHSKQLSTVSESVSLLNKKLSDMSNELIENNSRIAQLEVHSQELQADINLLNKPKPIPKPIAIEKPKLPEKPPVLISLLSIRIQGGSSWVSLREGVESSPLLVVGDEWHGAKLITADPIKKEAQFVINGSVTAVKL